MKPNTDVDHFCATYRAAMASIPDPGVRTRVEDLLSDARKVALLAEEEGSVRREQAAQELLALACQSPAVCEGLVRIVDHWPRKSKWLALYSLATRVVGELIVDEKLSPDLVTLAVRGMVESWLCVSSSWRLGTSPIGEQILDNHQIDWLRRHKPAVLLRECYRRLCDDPESYDHIDSLLDGSSEEEEAIMATWLKSNHPAPKRLARELGCGT